MYTWESHMAIIMPADGMARNVPFGVLCFRNINVFINKSVFQLSYRWMYGMINYMS